MRFEYQYLTSPLPFAQRNDAGAGSPKHHVVRGT
jgi:hypothetical protein